MPVEAMVISQPTEPEKEPVLTDSEKSNEKVASRPTLSQLQQVAKLPLRQPLVSKANTNRSTQSRVRPDTNIRLRLIGTANEPGKPMAIFQTSTGKISVRGVGQAMKDAGIEYTVTNISARQATVKFGSRTQTLKMPPKRSRGHK